MDTAELLKKVRRLEIKTKGLSRHLFTGSYHSAFKGRGMAFSEVRSYQYGDDVRNIDWNVTARSGDTFVKVFEEERELTIMLVADISGSVFFGSSTQLKSELLTELCAILAFSALNNHDKVGLLLFSDKIDLFLPPKKGRQNVLRIIRELVNIEPQNTTTNINHALEYLGNVVKKRSICFLISDFLQEQPFEKPLRMIANKHDLIGVRLFDALERNFPDIGLVPVKDLETGSLLWVDSSDATLRKQYALKQERSLQIAQAQFLSCQADLLPIATGDDYINILLSFFERRRLQRH